VTFCSMGFKVLVVDDDIDTLEVFAEFLEIKDVNVIGRGHDGKEAVELFEKHRPDFVLMDIMMPDYDGFYGIKEIRKIDPNAKIIIVTGDVSIETKAKLKDLKPSTVVHKPYEIDDLLEFMHNIENGQTGIVTPKELVK